MSFAGMAMMGFAGDNRPGVGDFLIRTTAETYTGVYKYLNLSATNSKIEYSGTGVGAYSQYNDLKDKISNKYKPDTQEWAVVAEDHSKCTYIPGPEQSTQHSSDTSKCVYTYGWRYYFYLPTITQALAELGLPADYLTKNNKNYISIIYQIL